MKNNWENDAIQFPRLISELNAMGAFTPEIMHELRDSMDLEFSDINDLIKRADEAWEKIKGKPEPEPSWIDKHSVNFSDINDLIKRADEAWEKIKGKPEPEPSWIDKHSVNCYFCNDLVDERECIPADDYNNSHGGDICPKCQKVHEPKYNQPDD